MSQPSDDQGVIPDEEWCFWHGREPIPDAGVFRVCGECCHAWPTHADFLTDVRQTLYPFGGKVQDLMFCPLCAHDF